MLYLMVELRVSATTKGDFMSALAPTASRAKRPSQRIHAPPRADLELISGAESALDVLQGRWKVPLLVFMARGIHRHNRLLKWLPGTSKKVMTDALRALERDGLVNRRVFAEVPVRVEYSLTALGWTVTEPLMALADWGETHSDGVVEARARAGRESRAA
jgi:DNA-binding HxlR family transcriptional regulator